jgi:enoyl-CoA hydratase/carnithine racemase
VQENWVLVERKSCAGIITINRPDVYNAWDKEMLLKVERTLDAFEADPEVRAIILTGRERRPSSPAATFRISSRAAALLTTTI